MASETFSFKPSDEQRDLVIDYQEEHGLKKSDALRELVDRGLANYYGGLRDTFFLELAKVSLGVALAVTFLWMSTDLAFRFYTYMFWGLSVGATALHYSPYNPVSSVFGSSDPSA